MIRQSLKERGFALPAGWQAPLSREEWLSNDPAELNQPHDCRSDHREEAQGQSVIIAQDAKAFDPPNCMLDYDPLAGNLFVLGFLLLCQLSTSGFLVRGGEFGMLLAMIAFVPHSRFIRKRLWQGGRFVELEVRLRSPMPGLQGQDFSVRVGGELRLERVAFLLPRVEALLPLLQRRPPHGRLKAVEDDLVYCLRRPRRLAAPPLFLGIPFLGGEEIPQDRHHFVKGVLGGVGTAPQQGPNHFVLHVMAQVDQGHEHLVHRRGGARASVVGDQLAFAVGAALQPCRATALQFWQDYKEQFAQEYWG